MFNAAVFGFSAFFAALLALVLLGRLSRKDRGSLDTKPSDSGTLVFLIRENRMIDANFAGHQYLAEFDDSGGGLPALRRALHATFDDADTMLSPEEDGARITSISRDGKMQASRETLGNTLRLKLSSSLDGAQNAEDIHRSNAQNTELATLRETTDSAPYLVWRETQNGTPIWVNRAYLETVRAVFGPARTAQWPLPRLFEEADLGPTKRLSIQQAGTDDPLWFECSGVSIGDDRLFTAFDANATVHAEHQLKEFMQTLAKTFAELTVGLAIFDRTRNLRLFNPSLAELTMLPADFLVGRPKLTDFLDRLRENRMMPEPKDYKEWRRRIADLETAAKSGSYSETWSLPGNLTYRVTGRPHPDGAIAFLFEDISAEISLTRQFRRELEISQTLLDNMEDATAHFSRGGALIQTNRAYRNLWTQDSDFEDQSTVLEEVDVVKASRTWHAASEPTPVWGDVRDFVMDTGERAEWEATVQLRDGDALHCRFVPIIGGGSQVIFRLMSSARSKRTRILELVR